MTRLLRLLALGLAALAIAGCAQAPSSADPDDPPRQYRRFTGQPVSGLGP